MSIQVADSWPIMQLSLLVPISVVWRHCTQDEGFGVRFVSVRSRRGMSTQGSKVAAVYEICPPNSCGAHLSDDY